MRLTTVLILSVGFLAGCSSASPNTGKDTGITTTSANYHEPAPATHSVPATGPRGETPAEALAALVRDGARVYPNDHDATQPLSLDLSASPDRNAALQHVVVLPNVRTLDFGVNKNPLTPAAYPYFDHLTSLEDLNLNSTAFTDEGMKHLAGLSHLRKLVLDHDPITDAGLAPLKNLKNLEVLSLSSTDVSDAGIDVLASLTSLTYVDLRVTKVTPLGAERLRHALPKAKVDR